MIRTTTYQSFEELADAMCAGEGRLHATNCALHRFPDADPCFLWQWGVTTFGRWLDHIGAKIEITDSPDSFYDFCAEERRREAKYREQLRVACSQCGKYPCECDDC